MNIWDIIILLILAAVVVLAFRYIKRNGGSCSCGCDSCPHCDSCKKKD